MQRSRTGRDLLTAGSSPRTARDDYWRDVLGALVSEVRKQLRAEIAKMARPGEEFFYTDENGVKQDRELHAAIINPVDYPIDEKIMGPIRARHRQSGSPGRRLSEPRASSICPRCRCGVLAVPDDPKPNALALDMMQRATIVELREDAAELGAIVREIQRPLPTLPLDLVEREAVLTILLLQSREREQHVLTLIAGGDARW